MQRGDEAAERSPRSAWGKSKYGDAFFSWLGVAVSSSSSHTDSSGRVTGPRVGSIVFFSRAERVNNTQGDEGLFLMRDARLENFLPVG